MLLNCSPCLSWIANVHRTFPLSVSCYNAPFAQERGSRGGTMDVVCTCPHCGGMIPPPPRLTSLGVHLLSRSTRAAAVSVWERANSASSVSTKAYLFVLRVPQYCVLVLSVLLHVFYALLSQNVHKASILELNNMAPCSTGCYISQFSQAEVFIYGRVWCGMVGSCFSWDPKFHMESDYLLSHRAILVFSRVARIFLVGFASSLEFGRA